jgi:hypothetical protein
VKHVISDMKRVLEAKEKRMEKAIERPAPIEEEQEQPAVATKPQPAANQRTLF